MNKPTSKFTAVKAMMRSRAADALSGTDRAILRTLWMDLSGPLAEDSTAPCRFSRGELAELSGFNERTVRRSLSRLVELGFACEPEYGTSAWTLVVVPDSVSGKPDSVSTTDRTLCPVPPDSLSAQPDSVSGKTDSVSGYKGRPNHPNLPNQNTEPAREAIAECDSLGLDQIARLLAAYPKHQGRNSAGRQIVEAVRDIAGDRGLTQREAADWLIAQAEDHWAHVASKTPDNPATNRYVRGLKAWLSDGTYALDPAVAFAHLGDAPKPVSFEDAAKAERLSMVDRGVAIARERRERRERRAAQ